MSLPHSIRAPRVLLLGAGFSTNNRGVAALACGTLAAIFHAFPEATVGLLDYSKEPRSHAFRFREREHRVSLVALRFSKNPFQPNHILRLIVTALFLRLLPAATRQRWIEQNPWLGPIARADLIGAISGGDSFSDLYGLRRLAYVSLPQLLVLAVGRPLVLLPQSYGPFRTGAGKIVARSILSRAQHIYTRDATGVGPLAALCPAAAPRMGFAFDMGFALEPHPPHPSVLRPILRLKQARPLVGVNVSGLLYAAKDGAFGLKANHAELMHDLVMHLVRDCGCAVVLIPHVFGSGGESDVTASLRLWRRLGRLTNEIALVDRELDQHEVKYVIGQCDFFIGARMHACIAALSQGVPAVALAYSDKFSGVLRSLNLRVWTIDLRAHGSSEVITAVEEAFGDRSALRAGLALRQPEIRETVLDFFRRPGLLSPGERPEGSRAIPASPPVPADVRG